MRGIYLFMLAAMVGLELGLGAIVAPVIFFPPAAISDKLEHFSSGVLMTEIFVRFGWVLLGACAISLASEFVGLFARCNFYMRFSRFMLALISGAGALAFVFYFTDFVLSAQALGAQSTATQEFASIHKASEYTFKVIMIAQALLFFLRLSPCKTR